jgi:hypothetical protein
LRLTATPVRTHACSGQLPPATAGGTSSRTELLPELASVLPRTPHIMQRGNPITAVDIPAK